MADEILPFMVTLINHINLFYTKDSIGDLLTSTIYNAINNVHIILNFFLLFGDGKNSKNMVIYSH